jgi:hypothetical protein
MSEKICATCMWWSDTPVNLEELTGFCYANADYTGQNDSCDFWQRRGRFNPETGEVLAPPAG